MAWVDAWNTGDNAVLEQWFRDNTGPTVSIDPTPIQGPITISSQADANAIIGKRVLTGITVAAVVDLHDFELEATAQSGTTLLFINGGLNGTKLYDFKLDGKRMQQITAALGGFSYTDVDIQRGEIVGHTDALRIMQNSYYRHLYIHDPWRWDDDAQGRAYDGAIDPHADGVQQVAWGGNELSECWIDFGTANSAHTACIIIKPDSNVITGFNVHHCYINGSGYQVSIHPTDTRGQPTNLIFDNNRHGRNYRSGVWSITATLSNVTRTNNVWADTLQPVTLQEGPLADRQSHQPGYPTDQPHGSVTGTWAVDGDAVSRLSSAWSEPVNASTLSDARSGLAAGTWTTTGSATGRRIPRGLAVGTWTTTGSATGRRIPRGSSAGAWNVLAAATGRRIPRGSAAGLWTTSGSAAGRRLPRGLAGDAWNLLGAATGHRLPVGAGAGSWSAGASASGHAPTVSDSSGTSSGAWNVAASVFGHAIRRGSAVVEWLTSGEATGRVVMRGSSSGSWEFLGDSVGSMEPHGAAGGSWTFLGVASGSQGVDGSLPFTEPTYATFVNEAPSFAEFAVDGIVNMDFVYDGVNVLSFEVDGSGYLEFNQDGELTGIFDHDGVALGEFVSDGVGSGHFG